MGAWELLLQELHRTNAGAAVALFAAGAVVLAVGFAIGWERARRRYSKRNMPEEAQAKIDELAVRLHDAEMRLESREAENRVLWSRYRSLAALAAQPLELEEEERRARIGRPQLLRKKAEASAE